MGTPLDTTRLSISGVRSRVALRVSERRDRQVTVEQKLPFLAIGTEVADENGRTGRIARVAVALERGVPKLVLELAYDAVPSRARRDETISYGQDQRPTVPEPLRPTRGLRLEGGDRSLPRQPAASPATSLAFPLEVRRSPRTAGPFAWLTRFFTR